MMQGEGGGCRGGSPSATICKMLGGSGVATAKTRAVIRRKLGSKALGCMVAGDRRWWQEWLG